MTSEAYMAKVRLVSASDETFSDLRAALILEDGFEVKFSLSFSAVVPHEEKNSTNYFYPGEISGHMRVRLHFRDANGRYWERINGEPVRELRRRSEASMESNAELRGGRGV
ncbi:hypothetical protein [Glutamicibacter arilaitensis]|uniref:hypothetical protein n=1 Tax=Glutamicibacter arilaitensis TaxID=256701 RepID=UPI00384E049D